MLHLFCIFVVECRRPLVAAGAGHSADSVRCSHASEQLLSVIGRDCEASRAAQIELLSPTEAGIVCVCMSVRTLHEAKCPHLIFNKLHRDTDAWTLCCNFQTAVKRYV